MWTWSLNWGEITPRIVVGSCPLTPGDLERIAAEAKVSAVLSLQHDACLAYWKINYASMCALGASRGLRMMRTPMRDFDIADQQRNLPYAVAALADLQAHSLRTYVHCTAGLGRAPLTILSYLTWIEDWSPADAIEAIHQGRPGAVPAWEAYHGCGQDLLGAHRARIEQRAYELFRLRAGHHGDPQSDWLQAEREVRRTILLSLDQAARKPA
jgi:hypothetical protein